MRLSAPRELRERLVGAGLVRRCAEPLHLDEVRPPFAELEIALRGCPSVHFEVHERPWARIALVEALGEWWRDTRPSEAVTICRQGGNPTPSPMPSPVATLTWVLGERLTGTMEVCESSGPTREVIWYCHGVQLLCRLGEPIEVFEQVREGRCALLVQRDPLRAEGRVEMIRRASGRVVVQLDDDGWAGRRFSAPVRAAGRATPLERLHRLA